MKRILSVILCLCFVFTVGCQSEKTENKPEKQEVVINMPTDDSVNGYRNEDYTSVQVIPETEVSVSNKDTVSSSYCGNKNSKVFHKSSCGSVSNMKDSNKVYFSSRDEFIENGYSPCQKCNP